VFVSGFLRPEFFNKVDKLINVTYSDMCNTRIESVMDSMHTLNSQV
jgi:hypothetical protein